MQKSLFPACRSFFFGNEKLRHKGSVDSPRGARCFRNKHGVLPK